MVDWSENKSRCQGCIRGSRRAAHAAIMGSMRAAGAAVPGLRPHALGSPATGDPPHSSCTPPHHESLPLGCRVIPLSESLCINRWMRWGPCGAPAAHRHWWYLHTRTRPPRPPPMSAPGAAAPPAAPHAAPAYDWWDQTCGRRVCAGRMDVHRRRGVEGPDDGLFVCVGVRVGGALIACPKSGDSWHRPLKHTHASKQRRS